MASDSRRAIALRRELEALNQDGDSLNAEDRARKLCERAGASRDPDELAEILVELRALMR